MSEKKNKEIKKNNQSNVKKSKSSNKDNKSSNKKTNKPKEAVVNTKETKNNFWANASELTRLIVVFFVVVAVFLVFYAITALIKSNTSDGKSNDNSVAVIQYDEILVGEILSQNKESYYVLASDENDPNQTLYVSYVGSYTASETADKVYTIDLSSVFNDKFVADESNFEISEIKDVRFKESTLLKIEDKKITEYYEGKDEIIEYLKELIG